MNETTARAIEAMHQIATDYPVPLHKLTSEDLDAAGRAFAEALAASGHVAAAWWDPKSRRVSVTLLGSITEDEFPVVVSANESASKLTLL